MSISDPKIVIEAALLTAGRPVRTADLSRLFEPSISRRETLGHLADLQKKWEETAVRLEESANGWRFVSIREMQPYLERLTQEKPPRYSRSFMETLAIIAYRQLVTRGDIEEIRGVSINTAVMKQLEERDWIECVGHRETPGRPALWATTKRFLQDFSLKSLSSLPALVETGQSAPSSPGKEGVQELIAGLSVEKD